MRPKSLRIAIALFLIAVLFIGESCQSKKAKEQIAEEPIFTGDTANLTGAQLARAYCQSCHLMPAPDLLPKEIWETRVLPNMALRLGVGPKDQNPFAGLPYEDILAVSQANIFPNQPRIAQKDWEKIVQYYLTNAPARPLPDLSRAEPIMKLPGFEPMVQPRKAGHAPLTTLVKYDAASKKLFLGDKLNNLFVLDSKLKTIDSIQLQSPPTDIYYKNNQDLRVLLAGNINPNDQASGQLISLNILHGNTKSTAMLVDKLKRPVQAAFLDLNQDKKEDVVICNYGNHTGKLAWYEKKHNGYEEHILKELAGARQVIPHDFNQDGLPDLMVLFAQGQEGVYIFFNEGNGEFSEKAVLRFTPVYGSAYIDLVDINKDGAMDILYANGDNADYSFTLKNYHGLRLFLNNGENKFKQAWFYPMHGASKALAHDFDQDGDMDIAAISFFPNYAKTPLEGFLYFENKGKLKYVTSSFKQADAGRWLTFDIGDFDQDQDTDIILGSFIAAPTPVPVTLQNKWQTSGANFLILKNTLKN